MRIMNLLFPWKHVMKSYIGVASACISDDNYLLYFAIETSSCHYLYILTCDLILISVLLE